MDNLLASKQANSNRKIQIDYLKMMAIIFVILQHTSSYCMKHATSNYVYFFSYINKFSSIVNVPIFIICAGYLCHRKKLGLYIKERFFRVLLPFYVFASLKLVYSLFISNEYAHGGSLLEQLFNTYIVGNVYWFCYAMMLIFILAPLLWTKDRQMHRINSLGLAMALFCVGATLIIDFFNPNLTNIFQFRNAIYYFPFFALGYAIKEFEDSINSFILKIKRNTYLILSTCIFMFCIFLFSFKIFAWSTFAFKIVAATSWFLLFMELLKSAPEFKVVRLLNVN